MLILVDAAQLLLFYPDRTATLWAWKLQPEVTAMVLALGVRRRARTSSRGCCSARRGSASRRASRRSSLFVWLAAVATILHEDRFIKDSLPFAAWVALYTVTPIGVPLLYLYNRRREGGPEGPALPRGVRIALAAAGGALVVVGAGVLRRSRRGDRRVVVDAHPADRPDRRRGDRDVRRACGSSVAADGTWRGARIPLQAHAIGLAFVLLAVARGEDVIDWGNALAIVFVAVAGVMLAISAALSRAGP